MFDVIVVGLGAMGSASAFHMAQRGQKVLGLDRFRPPHAFGSSHGQTRIIREAYFEHPIYVPLVQRAYQLWRELEGAAGRRLLLPTGGLMIGRGGGVLVRRGRRSAEQHALPHEILSAANVRHRFPALEPDDGMVAVWEPRAGILFPEACIAAHLLQAQRNGAVLRYDEPVLSWAPSGDGARVRTGQGEYEGRRLLLTAGSWAPSLFPDLPFPFQCKPQGLLWFIP